jgi:hypothetical protein
MSLKQFLDNNAHEKNYVSWAAQCAKAYERGQFTFEALSSSVVSLKMFHSAYHTLTFKKLIVPLEKCEVIDQLKEVSYQYAKHLPQEYNRYYLEALWVMENIINSNQEG